MGFKLVVKAPNQKYGDQTFDIEANWTVKQLKTFLSNEYPSKPAIGDQRLIYSGHLLRDDQALLDVFQLVSSNDSIVTIHLVCAQKTSEALSNSRTSAEATNNDTRNANSVDFNVNNRDQTNLVNNSSGFLSGSSVSQSQSQAATAAALTSSILAQMNANSAGNLFTAFANPLVYPSMPNAYLPLAAPAMMPPAFSGQSVDLSTEEINTMNQLYSRLLSSNVQPTGPLMAGMSSPFAFSPLLMNGQMGQAILQQMQQQQAPQPPAQQVPNQQAPIAPQALVDDDEVDNRDWLDMFHWISRAVVFISIVYFYSSVTRFILVISFALFVYFYQTGFFFPRNQFEDPQGRANVRPIAPDRLERPPAPRPPARNNDPVDQVDLDPLNNPQRQDVGGLRARRTFADTTETNESPAPTDERSSNLRMIWLVVSSLFTSLIPEQPQVNLH